MSCFFTAIRQSSGGIKIVGLDLAIGNARFNPDDLVDYVKSPSVHQVVSKLCFFLVSPNEYEAFFDECRDVREKVEILQREAKMNEVEGAKLFLKGD